MPLLTSIVPFLAAVYIVNFAVFVLALISKQPIPSPPPRYSKLDYYNSLYYNLPKSQLNRLQLIQDSLVHVKALKSFHISPILKSLQWLKTNECVEYKLLLLHTCLLYTSDAADE